MHLPIAPLTPAARVALGAYSAFPVRLAPVLIMRLTEIREYASALCHIAVWAETADLVDDALAAVCLAHLAPLGRRRRYRVFVSRIVLDAITAYEMAYVLSLPFDAAGRYSPEPGTEFPNSISDIGHAAVRHLGTEWYVEPQPWGVRAFLHIDEENGGYTVAVDGAGDLYVEALFPGGSRIVLGHLCTADDLDVIAACVADTIRELRKAD